MGGLSSRSRTRPLRPSFLAGACGLALALGGCGSSGNSDTTAADGQSGRPVTVSGGSLAQSVVAAAHEPDAKAGHQGASHDHGAAHAPRGADHPSGGGDKRTKSAAGQAETAGGHCPAGVTRAMCESDARAGRQHTPSYVLRKPSDCVRAASRSQCAARFREERRAARNAGPSYSVQKCLNHPTPACRKALGPILGAEQDAGN